MPGALGRTGPAHHHQLQHREEQALHFAWEVQGSCPHWPGTREQLLEVGELESWTHYLSHGMVDKGEIVCPLAAQHLL